MSGSRKTRRSSKQSPQASAAPDDRGPKRRALLSVADKQGLAPFAAALQELGFEIVSTGGTALALLVEEGKLEWDAPVIRYLRDFALSDPFVTRELTIRDLLVHRSGLGLGAGDLLWWPPSTYDRKEITRRLRFLPLATSFRSAYAYDNVLYGVAGDVIEAVSGKPWEDFVTERLLGPVGMTASNVWNTRSATGPDDAWPHARVEGRVQTIPPFRSDNVNPAGGINAGANDIA